MQTPDTVSLTPQLPWWVSLWVNEAQLDFNIMPNLLFDVTLSSYLILIFGLIFSPLNACTQIRELKEIKSKALLILMMKF